MKVIMMHLRLYWPTLATIYQTPLYRLIKGLSKLKYHLSNVEILMTSEGPLEDPQRLIFSPNSLEKNLPSYD